MRDGAASSDETTRRSKRVRSRVLLALADGAHPEACLKRACSVTARLSGELHVLRVFREPAEDLEPRDDGNVLLRTIDRTLRARRETQAWVLEQAHHPLSSKQLRVRRGSFVEQVAIRAEELVASLIVVPHGDERWADDMVTLAARSGIAVLVAKECASKPTILAATNLKRSHHSVLHSAARLGRELRVPVEVVHNLSPVRVTVGFEMAWSCGVPLDEALRVSRERALDQAAQHARISGATSMSRSLDTADGIVTTARNRDADLIVLGARRRSWFERLLSHDVASSVILRAPQSVLLTPIPPTRAHAETCS